MVESFAWDDVGFSNIDERVGYLWRCIIDVNCLAHLISFALSARVFLRVLFFPQVSCRLCTVGSIARGLIQRYLYIVYLLILGLLPR